MSTDRDPERIVLSWLRSDEHVSADRLLDVVLFAVDTTPQRPASWLAWRSPFMSNTLRTVLAAAAVVGAVVIGLQFIGQPSVVAPPVATPTADAAEPSSASTTLPLPVGRRSALTAGTYFLPDFPVRVAFTVPDRWQACSESPVEQLLCYLPGGGEFAGELGFVIVTNVAADPCAPGEVLLDPPVGPTVDDLVTALSNLEGFEVTTAVGSSVDGFRGKLLTIKAPSEGGGGLRGAGGCVGYAPWATEDRIAGLIPGETSVLRVIDVDGVRIMITSSVHPGSLYEAEFDEVLDSVQIEP